VYRRGWGSKGSKTALVFEDMGGLCFRRTRWQIQPCHRLWRGSCLSVTTSHIVFAFCHSAQRNRIRQNYVALFWMTIAVGSLEETVTTSQSLKDSLRFIVRDRAPGSSPKQFRRSGVLTVFSKVRWRMGPCSWPRGSGPARYSCGGTGGGHWGYWR